MAEERLQSVRSLIRCSMRIWLKMFVAAVICFAGWAAHSQPFPSTAQLASEPQIRGNSLCEKTTINLAARKTLRLVCQRAPIAHVSSSATSTRIIVIGFVGGFARSDDLHHPEVLFASYLREHYGNGVEAKVFSNHDAKDALSYVLQHLDSNHDVALSNEERNEARIIVYGHSWGASETAAFARELGRREIPVSLTIQLDIIAKPGQNPGVIPQNVAHAINFYQSGGPLHGRPKVIAANPRMTVILGNIRMEYDRSSIDCDNYNWFVRTFNKPHHEIENDAHVWDQIASLIDVEASKQDRSSNTTAVQQDSSSPTGSGEANRQQYLMKP